MKSIPRSIQQLIRQFNTLPGIGSKTSERFVYFLLRQPKEQIELFAESLLAVKNAIHLCRECYTFTEDELCAICADSNRNRSIICVVAEPKDVFSLDSTGQFDGVYHVLGGVIDHVAGIAPSMLRIQELTERVKNGSVQEVILATNPDMEGEATALYIKQVLQKEISNDVLVTKIARGLPVGGDIEFADEMTLGSALTGRRNMN